MGDTFVFVQLNARVAPMDRGDLFEDPLMEALDEAGVGQVTGGGTLMGEGGGEIVHCGIDVELSDLAKGIPLVCATLERLGAPKGSKLEYQEGGQKKEVPLGMAEGLAVYLNGTDLPEDVYKTCDVNLVYDRFNELLGDAGAIRGHWQGPTETALYVYGASADEMRRRIEPFMAMYPLCQRARVVQIA